MQYTVAQMITINLLPWREKLRQRRRRKKLLGYSVILVLLIVFLTQGHSCLERELNVLEKDLVYLNATLKALRREGEERNLLRMKEEAVFAQFEKRRRLRAEFAFEQQCLSKLSEKLPAQCCIEKLRIHSEHWSMLVQCKQDYKVRSLIEMISSVSGFRRAEVNRVESDEKNAVYRIEFKGLRVIAQGMESTNNREWS